MKFVTAHRPKGTYMTGQVPVKWSTENAASQFSRFCALTHMRRIVADVPHYGVCALYPVREFASKRFQAFCAECLPPFGRVNKVPIRSKLVGSIRAEM